jgi:DNA-binding LacI/PurR family transcriptional regulator
MSQKPYTIIDLARMLGMSKSTVSRALRDQYDVKPETREKVLELAKKLDFETNTLAASLRGNKSYIIGVIIPSFAIPFYSIAMGGIQAAASENGYNVMVCQTGEKYQTELDTINFLMKSRVDGILISLSKDTSIFDHLQRISKRGTPVVMFNRVSENLDLPNVVIDDYDASLMACRYLIESGCRRIAHISGPQSLILSQNRLNGFTDALYEAGLELHMNHIVESDFTLESGKMAARQLMSSAELPDALFCVCDAVAFGAMAVIREIGLRIPEDVSVMGFTNEPMSSIVSPTLSTISQPIETIGRTAVEVLLEHLNNPKSPQNRHSVVLGTELIIRESTRK